MSEEESKAIYRLNFHIKGADETAVVNKADVETVLNMIEEKNEEIERSEVEYHDLAGEIYRLETELEKKNKETDHWKYGFERVLEDNAEYTLELLKQDKQLREKEKEAQIQALKFDAEDERKDKIINLMAEQLAGLAVYKDDAEDLTDITILADKEEVVEYFERKVENGN